MFTPGVHSADADHAGIGRGVSGIFLTVIAGGRDDDQALILRHGDGRRHEWAVLVRAHGDVDDVGAFIQRGEHTGGDIEGIGRALFIANPHRNQRGSGCDAGGHGMIASDQ